MKSGETEKQGHTLHKKLKSLTPRPMEAFTQDAEHAMQQSPLSRRIQALEREVFVPISVVIQQAEQRAVDEFNWEQFRREWITLGEDITQPFTLFTGEAEELFHAGKFTRPDGPFANSYKSTDVTVDKQYSPKYAVTYRYHTAKGKVILDSYEQQLTEGEMNNNLSPRMRIDYKDGKVHSLVLLHSTAAKAIDSTTYATNQDIEIGQHLPQLLQRWQPYFGDVIQGGVMGIGFLFPSNQAPVFGAFSGESFATPFQQQTLYALPVEVPQQKGFSYSQSTTSREVYDRYWHDTYRKLIDRYNIINKRGNHNFKNDLEYFKQQVLQELGAPFDEWEWEHYHNFDGLHGNTFMLPIPKRPSKNSFSLNADVAKEVLTTLVQLIPV